MPAVCRWVVRIYLALWVIASALLVIGTYGLVGQEKDPLSGVFLIPLGLPWVLWTEGLPQTLRPVAAVAAPLVNIAVLGLICRTRRGARSTME